MEKEKAKLTEAHQQLTSVVATLKSNLKVAETVDNLPKSKFKNITKKIVDYFEDLNLIFSRATKMEVSAQMQELRESITNYSKLDEYIKFAIDNNRPISEEGFKKDVNDVKAAIENAHKLASPTEYELFMKEKELLGLVARQEFKLDLVAIKNSESFEFEFPVEDTIK